MIQPSGWNTRSQDHKWRMKMRRINEDGIPEVLVTFGHGTWQPESEPCWVTLEDYENPPECWTSRAHEVFDEE